MINVDALISNADWPKRTPDRLRDLAPDRMSDLQTPKALARKERPIHRLADSYLERVRMAVRRAFSVARQAVDYKKLDAARSVRDAQAAVKRVPEALEEAIVERLTPALEELAAKAQSQSEMSVERAAADKGDLVIRKSVDVPRGTKLRPPRPDSDRLERWAKKHAREVAKGMAKTTREAVSAAIEAAFERVDAGDSWKSVQASILKAVGDDERAELIAQNEVMAAVNAGQRLGWEEQVESGFLSGRERRVWVTFPDACPQCDELEGETAEIDGTYEGGIEGPPLHPRCRCIEELEDVRSLAQVRRPFPLPDFIILAGVLRKLRTLGGPGSGNFGHAGRPGEVGGSAPSDDPLAGEIPGQHTPAAAKRLIAYLERETDDTFGMHGSTKKGLTSTNDFDLVLTEPSEEELERLSDKANREVDAIRDRHARGEITEQQMMEEIYGEAPDKLTNALNKIGFEFTRNAEWLGILVTRFENKKTGHAIEIWQRGDPNKMPF